ncbi:MAG: hypothetical protein CVU05_12865 [Bacteroidetes bacterium HGW-Bacteroidetes-21]|nr:MAG: hypothetical protein CVU05_12865 [Bacteroidetes bacterium HGW-Bacteroidetes-21]
MASVQAQTEKNDKSKDQTTSTVTYGKYVDENKDGVCDNHQNLHQNVKGAAYVDKNEDGVCDNHYHHANHQGHGHGRHYGHHHGNGYGYRYGQNSEE